jgi:hypothetical protein
MSLNIPGQPFLFPEMAAVAPFVECDRRQAGKSVVQKLLKARRSLEAGELEYLPHLNELIDKIRAVAKFSDHQREGLVLYSIERSGACTLKEISEDTRLPVEAVKEIVETLGQAGTLYMVRRYVPGSDRPQYSIKSRRVKIPEAD